MLIRSNLLSDSRKVGINQSVINQVIILSDLQPMYWLELIPYGGYSNNLQVDEDDTGRFTELVVEFIILI